MCGAIGRAGRLALLRCAVLRCAALVVIAHVQASVVVNVTNGVTGQSAAASIGYLGPTVLGVSGCSSSPTATSTADCPNFGSVVLTVFGLNFGSAADAALEATNVTVGSIACSGVQITVANSNLTCVLGGSTRFGLDVTVTRGGRSSVLAGALSFAGPTISAHSLVFSSSGGVGGGGSSSAGSIVASDTSGGVGVNMSGVFVGSGVKAVYGVSGRAALSTFAASPSTGLYECGSAVVWSNRTLTCSMAPGVGQNLTFQVFIDGTPSNIGVDTVSYPLPTITPGSLAFFGGVSTTHLISSTTQGQYIQFRGANLAPSTGSNANLLSVTYGPVGNEGLYPCYVDYSSSNASFVRCLTQPGVGDNVFRVTVGPAYGAAVVFSTDVYSYPVPPTVVSVSGCTDVGNTTTNCPTSAVQSGSSAVVTLTVVGTSFQVFSTAVSIGGVVCSNVIAWPGLETEKLTCLLPVGSGVSQSVVVSTGTLYGLGVPLLSYALPVVAGVSGCTASASDSTTTVECPRSGGVSITVSGSDFGASGAVVIVGGAACQNVTLASGYLVDRTRIANSL